MIRYVVIFLVALSAHAETLTGYVVGVSDGDTIIVLDSNRLQYKIRLAGIDAPEKAQAFGDRSKQNLATLAFNKHVTVDWSKLDRYGRTVGKVTVNGIDANLAQIQAGMAWWYEKYRKEQSPADQQTYSQTEQQARLQRVGLWSDKGPTPPWEFRHSKDGVQQEQSCKCPSNVNCTGPKGGQYCQTESGSKKYR